MNEPLRNLPYRCRVRPAPRGNVMITDRDDEVLVTAFLNPATRSHHYRYLFPSVKARNERLRTLFDHNYLTRTFPSCSAFGGAVYHIGKAGLPIALAALASRGLEFTQEDIDAQRRRPALSVLAHALRVADVFVACWHNPASIGACLHAESFYPERLVRIEYEIRAAARPARWQRRCFAPDGAFLLATEGSRRLLLFLEIDMGTVSRARFANKCAALAEVIATGLVAARFGHVPVALAVLADSEVRLRALQSIVRGRKLPTLLFGTFSSIGEYGLSSPWSTSSGSQVTLSRLIHEGGEL